MRMFKRLSCRVCLFSVLLLSVFSGPLSPAQAAAPFIEITLDPSTISFTGINPIVGNYGQARTATVASNRPWQLFVRKARDLTSPSAGRSIPSDQFKFTSPTQPDPVEFSFSDTLVSQGEETTGTNTTMSYDLQVTWDDAAGDYETEHIYTVIPSLDEEMAGGISIDSAAEFTNDATVSIETSVTHAGFMRFSTESGVWTDWQPYETQANLVLPTGDGTKTISAQFKRREDSINTFDASDVIVLDTQAPSAAIATPTDGARVHGQVSIDSAANDGLSGVNKVALLLNDTTIAESMSEPYDVNLDTTPYTDGPYTLKVNVEDKAGNTASATSTINVDNNPPATVALVQPSAPDGENGWYRTAAAELLADEIGVTYYRWDSDTFQPYLGGSIVATEGIHTLDFYSVDTVGNTETVQSRTFKVDSGQPTNPGLSSPSHTTGVPSNDKTVDINLSGATDAVSGVAGYSVSWSQNGTQTPPATVNQSTNTTTSGPLADGLWYCNVRTQDAAGNWTTGVSHAGPFTIDTTAPVTTLTTSPTVPNGDNGWFKTTTPTITLTRNESSTAFYKWDSTGTTGWTTSTASPTTFGAIQGQHTLYYYSKDTSLTEATKSQVVKVDTKAPINPTIASPSHTTGTPSRDNTVDIALSNATDTTSGVAGYSVLWSQNTTQTPAQTVNQTANTTTSPPLADGTWYFNLLTKDGAGNWSGAVNRGPFVIDANPPTTTLSTSPTAPNGANGWFKTTVPTITLTRSETSGTTFRKWDSTGTAGWTTSTVSPVTFSALQGQHTLYYYSKDAVNNTETIKSQVFKVDTNIPSTPVMTAPAYASNASTNTTFVVNWSATDTSPSSGRIYDIQYKDSTTGAWTPWLTLTETTSAKFGGVAGKTYYFRAQSADKAGNANGVWSTQQATVVPFNQTAAAYFSTWSTASNSSLFMGDSRWSATTNASATLSFTSAYQVSLIATKASNMGRAKVYIGTTLIATVDLYSATTQYRAPVVISTYAAPTSGTLRVVVAGTKTSKSSGYRVELDGIAIKQ